MCLRLLVSPLRYTFLHLLLTLSSAAVRGCVQHGIVHSITRLEPRGGYRVDIYDIDKRQLQYGKINYNEHRNARAGLNRDRVPCICAKKLKLKLKGVCMYDLNSKQTKLFNRTTTSTTPMEMMLKSRAAWIWRICTTRRRVRI